MSAIFGFSGSQSENTFNTIKEQLKHRGENVDKVETPYGTVGVCYHDYENGDSSNRKVAQSGKTYCAISGECYSNKGKRLSANEIVDLHESSNGIDFIKQCKGDFVLATLTPDCIRLLRDGAGVRTAYYSEVNSRFVFSSEPKGITALSDFQKKLRQGALLQFLSFSFIPGAETFLENLKEIPPGHHVQFKKGYAPEITRYFTFEHLEGQKQLSEKEWIELFEKHFSNAVDIRIPSHTDRFGLFLSGGLDSSIVAAQLAQKLDKKIKTYSIHFGKDYPNELDFARSVAEYCGTEHHEVEIKPQNFLPRLRKMIWHLDDPIGDPITMPNFELSSRVANDIDFVFNGEGGDPLFGGPKNIPLLLHHWYGGNPKEKHFRELAYLQSYRRAFEDFSNLLTPDFQNESLVKSELIDVLTPFFECSKPQNFLNKLMTINIRLKGAHLILPKVERMTGAWGLTPLAPLFDEDLIKLSFQIPPTLKLKNGIEKLVLKKAFQNRIPQPVIDRPKSGMRVPVHYWFKKELRRYCKSILSKKNVERAGIFRYERIKQLIDYDIDEGPGRYGLRLWMIMTFEIWRRIVIENEPV